MVKRCLAILVLLVVPAIAEPLSIKGTFGFNWDTHKPSKCAAITGALLTKLTKEYTCVPPKPDHESASGVKIVAMCKAKQGDREYELYASAKDCNAERETQLANGD